MQIHRACHCGAASLTAGMDPSRVVLCHCMDCQVMSGSAARPQRANFSVGCYCEREDRCHRSVLRELLQEPGAAVFPSERSQGPA
ncbi:MAG TPA: hypothetical protein VKT00_07890 [Casimicrobiaceae bacterium]|nr:hypothetical protein [Casimicrobiaceae bacterium]